MGRPILCLKYENKNNIATLASKDTYCFEFYILDSFILFLIILILGSDDFRAEPKCRHVLRHEVWSWAGIIRENQRIAEKWTGIHNWIIDDNIIVVITHKNMRDFIKIIRFKIYWLYVFDQTSV